MYQNYYIPTHNKALYKVLSQFLVPSDQPSRLKLIGMDNVMNDFGDLLYCVITKSDKSNEITSSPSTILELHVDVPNENHWSSIKSYALNDVKNAFEGNDLVTLAIEDGNENIRDGYKFAFILNCNDVISAPDKERNVLLEKLSNLHSLVLGSQLRSALKALQPSENADNSQNMSSFLIPIRNSLGACLVIKQGNDRINIVFDVHYDDVNERAIARTYLKQFSVACRFCAYHKWNDLPLEVTKLKTSTNKETNPIGCSEISAGFLVITFQYCAINDDTKIDRIINFVVMFLINLLHDVIATKTDLYARIRHNGDLLLQKFMSSPKTI